MSSSSADAAEQVVRISMDGAEFALRVAGSGAKQLAVLLYAVLKDQRRTKGRIRLANMLRSGKELRIFAIRDQDLQKFCGEAKKYGVLYTVLKDRDAEDGLTDLMVRAEDASKINRIIDRFRLSTVDMGSVLAQIEREQGDPENARTERAMSREEKTEAFLDLVLNPAPAGEEQQNANPRQGRTAGSRQSAPTSGRRAPGVSTGVSDLPSRRPSVRRQLEEIRRDQERPAAYRYDRRPQIQRVQRRKRERTKKEER